MSMARIKLTGQTACYHCVGRSVAGAMLFGDLEKEILSGMLWDMAGFCGMEVITYCIMSNHFHVLVRVPEPQQLTDAQLLERLEGHYGARGTLTLLAWEAMTQRGKIDEDIRRKLLERMGDVSVFMRELKQRFSRWYNRKHERFGTLWAERFRSVVVENQPSSLEAVAAYIDLNPVRAGLVEDPKEYRFCGYAAAVAGNALARKGLMSFQNKPSWRACAAAYRLRLFVGGGAAHQSGKAVLDKEKIKEVIAQGGELSLGQVLRLRVRHMSDGVALGTKAFVNEVFTQHREKFGKKRKDGARPIRALSAFGLTALRNLRVRALG